MISHFSTKAQRYNGPRSEFNPNPLGNGLHVFSLFCYRSQISASHTSGPYQNSVHVSAPPFNRPQLGGSRYLAIIPCVWLACAHLFPAHLSHASASNDDDDDDDATRKIPSLLYCAGFALICGWAMFFQSSPVKIFWKSRLHHHLDGRLGVFHKHCPCCSLRRRRTTIYLPCLCVRVRVAVCMMYGDEDEVYSGRFRDWMF